MLNRVLQFSLMLVFVLSSFSHFSNQMETLHSENEIYKTGTGSIEGDAWLSIDLISWQVNSSVIWDADDTLFDPQFYLCIDIDGDTDGISPECVWTEIWYDTIDLENSWNVTFDLPESFEFINITIECWDNDELSDEWNDGPDACDMNGLDDEWKFFIEINSTSAETYQFNGSGYGDSNSQGSKGDGNISVRVDLVHLQDSDGDGIADEFDDCNQTPPGREVSMDGCWWMEGDIDHDGIVNPMDYCNGLNGDCKISGQYIIQGDTLRGVSWFDIDGEIITLSRGENNVFRALNETGHETNVRTSGYGEWKFGGSISQQTIGFSPDSNYFFMFQDTGSQHNPCSLNLNKINSTGFTESLYVASYGSKCSIALFAQEKLYVWFESGEIGYYEHVELLDYVSGITAIVPSFNQVHTLEDATGSSVTLSGINPSQNLILFRYSTSNSGGSSSMMLDVSDDTVSSLQFDIQNWEDRTGFLSDRHFIDGELIYDLISGSSSTLQTSNTAYHPGDYPVLTTPGEGSGVYTLMNPVEDIESKIIDCYAQCNELNSIAVSPDGSKILVGSDWYETEYEGVPFFVGYADYDLDGIPHTIDICENTTQGMSVNDVGCAENQKDDDSDGVLNSADMCPNTSANLQIDETGCAQYQLDDDIDGVANDIDVCPNSPGGETVDLSGCSSSQIDIDEDGIYDSQDNCPSTPSNTTVDSTGCAPNDVVDLDSDGDGVRDSVDACPNSATGIIVDSTGCETSGDVQGSDDNLNTEDFSGLLYVLVGLVVVVVIIATIFLGIAVASDGIISAVSGGVKSIISYRRENRRTYSSVGNQRSALQGESNLELRNVVSELERQRRQSEHEINQLKQQQNQLSSASEIKAMQREMEALQQRVADAEQAKLQLQNEIEQVKVQKDESVKMQDSVVGGDMVASGGQKIESQTNVTGTDPEAIARIIFEAQEKERERLRKERNE